MLALEAFASRAWPTAAGASRSPARLVLHDLQSRAAQRGLASSVRFLGHRTDVLDLMGRSRMLLATAPAEHFGLTVLEAMSCGLPVVAAGARVTSRPRRRAGHALFAPGDAAEAAALLRELADDDARWTSYAGAQRAEQRQVHGRAAGRRDRRRLQERALMDLVVTSLEAWDTVWRRNQHLVAGLLRRDPTLRVLFVEPATDPCTRGWAAADHGADAALRAHVADGIRRWWPVAARADEVAATPGRPVGRRTVGAAGRARGARARHGLTPCSGSTTPAVRCSSRRRRGARSTTSPTTGPSAERPAAETHASSPRRASSCRVRRGRRLLAGARKRARAADRDVTLVPNGVDAAAYAVAHARPGDLPDGTRRAVCRHPPQRPPGRRAVRSRSPKPSGPRAARAARSRRARDRQRATLEDAGVVLLGRPAERRGAGLPPARRRARRAARRDALHRQPRPDQALRVPGGRPAGRVDAGGRISRHGRRPRDGRRRATAFRQGLPSSLDAAERGRCDRAASRCRAVGAHRLVDAESSRWQRCWRACGLGARA